MTGLATTEWPREQAERLAEDHPRRRRDARIKAEIDTALSQVDDRSLAVAAISRWLGDRAAAGEHLSHVEDLSTAVTEELHRAGLPDEADRAAEADYRPEELVPDLTPMQAALVARAAFHLFGEASDEVTWRVIDSVRRVSDRMWFAIASCLDRATAEPGLRRRLISAANSLLAPIVEDPTTIVPPRSREVLGRMFEQWRYGPKLLEIWFGVRDLGFVDRFGGDLSILGDLARADPRFVADWLARFDVPHPVVAILDETDAERRFATWASLVRVAPTAFEADGRWSGSPILPALLVIAERACRDLSPGLRDQSADSVDPDRETMPDVVRVAADVVRGRDDGASASFRWAAWLVRSFMAASNEIGGDPANPQHKGFPQWSLVNALAAGSHETWATLSTPDCEEEAWFGLMVRILAATGDTSQPRILIDLWGQFVADWPKPGDDPDEWIGTPGGRLRAVSSVVRTFSRRLNGPAIGILAIPLAATPDPASQWQALWRRCLVMRECVEFAGLTPTPSHDDERTSAVGLSRLAFDVGLCALDRLLAEDVASTMRRDAAANLLPLLWDAAREMAAIDRFEPDVWASALRHVVVRRAAFADDPRIEEARRILPIGIEPTLARMLRALAGVDREFFALLRALLGNGMPFDMLREAFEEADVDLRFLLDSAERANHIDDRRPVLSAEWLAKLRNAIEAHR